MNKEFWIYLAILSGSTYIIRALPFAAMKRKITNRFARSFLYYIPYTVLAAMTFPLALYATGNIYSASAALFVAVIVALFGKGLTPVAVASCVTAYLVEFFMR